MCDKTVNTHLCTIQSVPECYKSQEICDKAVNKCFFEFDSIPDGSKTQEICDRVVSEDPFRIVYCPDKHKTQRMCEEAVDDCLAELKFIADWFARVKWFLRRYAILYFNEHFGNTIFSCNEMGIFNIDLNNINLDDSIYNEMTQKLLIILDLSLGKNANHLKKS